MKPKRITLALLAGGRSRRMGVDKAQLDCGGKPLARCALEALRSPLDGELREVLIAGGTRARGEALGALVADEGLRWRAVDDEFASAGPLAGILAVLEAALTEWVLVGACDRPCVEPRLLRHLVALAASAPAGTEAVLPAGERGLEPLLALYHRNAAPRLRAELARGRRAVVDFLEGGRILVCSPEEVAALDPERRSFGNLNSPQDLRGLSEAASAFAMPPPGDGRVSPMEREREEILKPVAAALRGVPPRIRSVLEARQPPVQAMLEHLSRYEGKMLRPALVLLTAGAVGKRSSPLAADDVAGDLLEVAAIVEMVHVATLVHDDVLDEAEVRRRVPSVNARFGNHVAVLLGDYIYARAFHLATRLDSPACAQVLSEVTRELCEGQIAELAACRDFGLGEEGYLRIAQAKTASLYGAACRLGGVYAGVEPSTAAALERFGRDLGLGFQIVDDCLDLSGREDVVGKSLGTDLCEGKVTLPLFFAHQRADHRGRRRIEQMYAALPPAPARAPARDTAPFLAELREELDLSGAIEAALRRADDFLRRASEAIAFLPESPFRASLARLPEYILCREW